MDCHTITFFTKLYQLKLSTIFHCHFGIVTLFAVLRKRLCHVPESDDVVGQSLEAWPVLATGGTLATKPIPSGESSLPFVQALLREYRSVVFSDHVSRS